MKTRISRICLPFLATALFVSPVFAGSAQWLLNPGSSDWNTAANWNPATVPNGSADTATFDLSNTTNLSLSANTQVNGIVFTSNVTANYHITTPATFVMSISGVGITENANRSQIFITGVDGAGHFGQINFTNSANANAGTVVETTNLDNTGATVNSASGGNSNFFNNSTASTANIVNRGGTASGAGGGFTTFHDTSTAGDELNNEAGVGAGAGAGFTQFFDHSAAAHALITNVLSATGGNASFTDFFNMSSADHARIVNDGGNTLFHDTSTAGSATVENDAAFASGFLVGVTIFHDSSTAGSATITNFGGAAVFLSGGATEFFDTSSAGSAFITNQGASATNALSGSTRFLNNSIAGTATINNMDSTAGANGGTVEFGLNASADHATITNFGQSTAAGAAGLTAFDGTATGGSAIINNNGATIAGGLGGRTFFDNLTTAGSATVTSNGATFLNALGGRTEFLSMASAGSATLIANGGTGGGLGGTIKFFMDTTGGTSRVEAFGNGALDISIHNAPGVEIGSLEGDGNVFLGANNLTVGNLGTDTTFSGVIQGVGGSLTKVGTGAFTLSGMNTYTLDTFVDGGALIVNGSIASPATFVDVADALLGGNGTIGGNVNSFGIVSPGDNGPGTLHVTGIYQQFSTSTLRIEIGGVAAGQHDLLAGANNTFLDGTLQLLRINNFMPALGDHVVIVSGTGLGGTMFSAVDSSTFVGLIQPNVVYTATTVDVVFDLSNTFLSQALTFNQRAVAAELDEVANDPLATDLINFLGHEPPANLPHEYDLIAPEELASIYEIGFSQAVVQNMNLQHRMDDIRAGSNGFCSNGYQAQATGGYGKESDGKVALDKNPTPAFVPTPENRWGIFVTGSGDFVNVGNHDLNAHGYDITTGDVMVGVDYRVCDHFAVGIDGSYSGSTADLVDRGRVEVDGGKAGAYATVFGYKILGSVIHIDGAVSGGWNSYDTHRTGLEDLPVLGSTNGSELNAMLAYGGDWHFGCLLIGTWSSLQYTNVQIDSFTETGSLAPLEIQDQNGDSFRTSTGLRAAYDIKAGRAIIRPEVRGAWQHEYGDRAYPIDARLASGAGDVFTVHGPAIGRDSALVDAGIAVQWNNRFSIYVYYDGVLGRSNYDNNAVSGGLRVSF